MRLGKKLSFWTRQRDGDKGTLLAYTVVMRVLLADDCAPVRWALGTFLREQLGWTIVGEVAHSEALLAKALALRPELILMAWELPGQPAGTVVGLLRRQLGSCKIVVLDQNSSVRAAALRAGGDAFICKIGPPHEVLSVLREVGVNPAHNPPRGGPRQVCQTQS